MYNKVVLMGNLTRDVEIRYSQGGSAIGNSGIAVNRKWKSQAGEQKEEVMFVDLTFFGRTAEIANQYLRKGKQILVDGRLNLEQWTAQDGTKRSRHTIIVENLQMIGGRDDNTGSGDSGYGSGYNQNQQQHQSPQQQNHQYGGGQQQAPQYNQQPTTQRPPTQQQQQQPQPTPSIPEIDISEDEIPF
jgi:single-strand DNA-binding protein